MAEQLSLFADIDADTQAENNWHYGVRMLRYALESRLSQSEGMYCRVNTRDLYRLIQFIDNCEQREARMAEICRIKDDLINKQFKRIMRLEGVHG